MTTKLRTYTELRRLRTMEERYNYLRIGGRVGQDTFGFDRYMNQKFYTGREWRQIRHHVIARDLGCDMGLPDQDIHDKIIIHHMNPLVLSDLVDDAEMALDPEYLISVRHSTHNAIHYGDASLLPKPFVERAPNDTKLW